MDGLGRQCLQARIWKLFKVRVKTLKFRILLVLFFGYERSYRLVFPRIGVRFHQITRQRLIQDIVNQRALAGSAYPGHASKTPNGDSRIYIFKIVMTGAGNLKPAVTDKSAFNRYVNPLFTAQILCRQRIRCVN